MPEAFNDHFSGHAADYRTFRPTYPPALFAFLASAAPARELVWDCGTGSGQAAVALAEHFAHVFATDASAEQIARAEPHPRVEYAVAPAEACPLPDASADLVTVAQALHWFDFARFYAEVNRVLKPGGLLAAWSVEFETVTPAVDAVVARLLDEFVGAYWPPERALVDDHYRSIPFPFDELPTPAFEMTAEWPLAGLLGYARTWSCAKRFEKARGFDPVARLAAEFASAWGDPATRAVRWRLSLRLGRAGGANSL